MAIGRSEAGRKNRQNILDYMHKMGRPVSCREICTYLDQAQEQTRARLAVMRKYNEVAMTMGLVGNYPTPLYAPLVVTTTPILLNAKTSPKDVEQHQQSPSERTKPRLKGTIHWGTHRDRPLQNQGGQGATPLEFGIRSAMG